MRKINLHHIFLCVILCCAVIAGTMALTGCHQNDASYSLGRSEEYRSEAALSANVPAAAEEDFASSGSQSGKGFLWGQLERQYQEEVGSASDAPAIIGEHFTIPFSRLNYVTAVQSMIDSDPAIAEEHAKTMLVEKYALYYQAQESGVVVSDAYLDDLIEENISIFEEAMPDNPDYVSFLEGLEMTNEEYWLSCKDNLRMTESIGAWKDLKYDEFIRDNGYDTAPPENLPTLWEEYYDGLKAEIIAQEHIRYADEEPS